MRCYIHYYDYDVVGNFIEMKHTVTGGTGNWTRIYTTGNDSNRLSETVVGSSTPEEYAYDNRGNITGGLNHLNANGVSMVDYPQLVLYRINLTVQYLKSVRFGSLIHNQKHFVVYG